MRCRIVRASDDYELNIRDTDEIAEDRGMSDADLAHMVNHLRTQGRFWLDADTIVFPVK
jgi:hypothetical protein